MCLFRFSILSSQNINGPRHLKSKNALKRWESAFNVVWNIGWVEKIGVGESVSKRM